jgi:YggT family protein
LIEALIWFVNLITRVTLLLVIAQVFMSYFMNPYHPLRRNIDRIVEPLLAPIRRFVPPVGMIDFSPLVLIIILQVLNQVIVRLLISLR